MATSAIETTLAAREARSETAVLALVVVTLVWTGALLGVSFIATPVKFLAPSLSLPVALDVGRQTFFWFTRVEIVLALAALGAALVAELPVLRRGREGVGGIAPMTLLGTLLLVGVAAQVLWLLPVLDARVEIILQGGMPPPSKLHDVYVVVEALKLGALVGLAWAALRALRGGAVRAES